MKTLSKFILNRNDQVFYYVEKTGKKDSDVNYIVYEDSNNKEVYNQHNFHAIYGSDVKISIKKFAIDAINVLIHGVNSDEKQEKSYNYLLDIADRLEGFDKVNPKINTQLLLESLEVYNHIIPNFLIDEIDYTEDYEFINGIKESTKEREHVSVISNALNKDYSLEETQSNDIVNKKGISRVYTKYDN